MVGLALASGLLAATAQAAGTPTPVGGVYALNGSQQGWFGTNALTRRADGSMVAAWSALDAAQTTANVYVRILSADGTPQGTEFIANDLPADATQGGGFGVYGVAADAQGNFVVMWTANSSTYSLQTVVGHRFSAAGQSLGPDFRIDSDTFQQDDQWIDRPTMAMDDAGNFAVAWYSYTDTTTPDGSPRLVVERFAADGTPRDTQPTVIGGEVVTTGKHHIYNDLPSIAMNRRSGDFAVAWVHSDFHIVGSPVLPLALYGSSLTEVQRYSDSGKAAGLAVRVLTTPYGKRDIEAWYNPQPKLLMDGSGNFVATWMDASGVYAHRYTAAGWSRGPQFLVSSSGLGLSHSISTAPTATMAPSGSWVVAWTDLVSGDGLPLLAQAVAADGTLQGSTFHLDPAFVPFSSETIGSEALCNDDNGNLLATWASRVTDNFGQLVSSGLDAQAFKSQ